MSGQEDAGEGGNFGANGVIEITATLKAVI
jgi:hypothetical protein